jgi:hypothetical protein
VIREAIRPQCCSARLVGTAPMVASGTGAEAEVENPEARKEESVRVNKTMQAMGFVMVMALAPVSARTPDDSAAPGEVSQAAAVSHALSGSWVVTYDVPAFGPPFPLLLSLADGGVVIETDAPGIFPLGPSLSVILSNGHGAWSRAKGNRAFSYVYRKLIFQQDGITPFGMARTRAAGTVQRNGQAFRAEITIELSDLAENVFFETRGTATGTRITVAEE